jgi:subtilisin family serine protease
MTTLNASPDDLYVAALAAGQPGFTGRQIVTFNQGAKATDMTAALGTLGQVAAASDFADSDVDFDGLGDAAVLLFEQTGTAILTPMAMPVGVAAVDAFVTETAAIASIDPELFAFPNATAPLAVVPPSTWGLDKTNVLNSAFSGAGIKVAVLDTGFDLGHPDFAGRQVTSSSFVPNQTVQDLHGHGTHCIGTACGPLAPNNVPRYGIAHDAHIFAGKVLSNSGTGSTGGILAGINWAIANGCQVISMSLGSSAGPQPYYEQAAQRALAAGSLIIAAAGNASGRPGYIAPTGAPANSPSAFAVAALDPNLGIASFSSGGKIEIAGPGVDVFSAAPRPRLYATMSGTSMATPHVAGIAALWAQSNPALRGAALAAHLKAMGYALPLPPRDIGSGLVQA